MKEITILNHDSQKELSLLETKFKEIENNSLVIASVPEEKYLCIRLDGFKATNKHLKDALVNESFNQLLSKGFKKLFYSFRNNFTREFTSSIVCAYIANDEISIVLNKDNTEDGKRVMKLCTLFSGALSAYVTLYYKQPNPQKRDTIAFDARPLILSRDEIAKYLRYRYLISKRYAYWKVLRLNEVDGVYEDDIKRNIDNAIKLTHQIDRECDALKIISSYKFLLTEKSHNPKFISCHVNDTNMMENNLHESLEDYLKYLHTTKKQGK